MFGARAQYCNPDNTVSTTATHTAASSIPCGTWPAGTMESRTAISCAPVLSFPARLAGNRGPDVPYALVMCEGELPVTGTRH